MLLIFTYYRRDIFAGKDYGFIQGLKILYDKKEISDVFLAKIKKQFKHHETLLTFCL
jgi:3-methyladenine DNA glycosylase/8-oxoguanine DNA glycosylase